MGFTDNTPRDPRTTDTWLDVVVALAFPVCTLAAVIFLAWVWTA